MSKKYGLKKGLRFGIYITVTLIISHLLESDHITAHEVTGTVISAVIGGAFGGLIAGWLFTFNPKSDFVKSLTNTDEHLLFDTPASYSSNKKLIPGTLCLTNKRLVFQSHSVSMKNYNLSIDLDDIHYAERYKNFGFFKNGLSIHTAQNTTENFVVEMASEWMKIITKNTGNLAQAAY